MVMAAGLLYLGFSDMNTTLGNVGLRIGIVGSGLGLFQSATYSLMMGSVPPERFGTAGAALSLAQSCGRVLSVAVIGGVFGWRSDQYLAELGIGLESEGMAFIKAFRDVFLIGSSLGFFAALVFLIGGWGQIRDISVLSESKP